MKTSELKNKIHQTVDQLDEDKLNELYGTIQNLIHGNVDESEWKTLTVDQKKGIYNAITEVESGKYLVHEDVMNLYKSKLNK